MKIFRVSILLAVFATNVLHAAAADTAARPNLVVVLVDDLRYDVFAGIRPASRCDAVVANIDLAPTLLDLAGVTIPEQMDGKSLRPLLSEPNADTPREALLYEYYWEPAFPQTPTTFALREGRYKLIQYHGIWDTDELYDLATDPDETRNLILEPEQQDRVGRMRRQLHERLRETRGLEIPLGFKRNHGSNQRRADGSKRARFPEQMISP